MLLFNLNIDKLLNVFKQISKIRLVGNFVTFIYPFIIL